MIFNTPALDYWRATTAELSRMDEMVSELVPRGMDGENWRFLQYSGKSYGGVKIGSAIQLGKPSYIIDVSGEAADDLWPSLRYSEMNVTRVDLQYTVPKPDWWDTVEFHFEMELGDWPNGIKRHVQARLNAGNDTVYVGSRTSERYIRVYVKEVNFVRFEVEYKGDRAREAWREIKSASRSVVGAILLGELKSLPKSGFTEHCIKSLSKWATQEKPISVPRHQTTDIEKLRWLVSLLPTIKRMMSDHDYGDRVLQWFVDATSEEMHRRYENER